MHSSRRIRLALFLATVAISAAIPAAAQPGTGTCVMGETRRATGGQDGLYGYSVTIYQWMDPATCGFCLVSDGAIQLRTVELDVFNSQPVGKLVGATVSVIGWRGTAACPEPDESVVLMPPQPITVVVPTGPRGFFTITAPIVASPRFVQPAFFKLAFTPVTTTFTDPAFGQVFSLTCPPCRQYISATIPSVFMADACSGGSLGPWTVRPRGDCVAVTVARQATWGRLKSFYH